VSVKRSGFNVLENLEPRLLMSSGAIIVTSEALAGAFQDVADWYTQKGHAAVVVTTETISSTYSGGDLQEQIRNCIIDYHTNRGVGYVLLGGDNSVVPDRDTVGYVHTDMPSDLYYSSLTGDWDADGDGLFAEVGQDNVNFTYDTIVGRYPVQTIAEVQIMLAKVVAYETAPPATDWATDMLATGSKLWDPGDSEAKSLKATSQYVSPYWSDYTLDTLFDTSTSWDTSAAGDYTLNTSNLLTAMSNDYQFMHMSTHGATSGWALESGFFSTSTIMGMSDTVNIPIVSTIACDTGGFDEGYMSLSEAFLRSDKTGTVVYLGSSREGWGIPGTWLGPSFEYSYAFYEGFLTGDSRIAGEVFAEMKSSFASRAAYDGSMRWINLSLNFQGDPLVRMYLADPTVLDPTFQGTITEGTQSYEITDLPAGAEVVLWQDDDVYIMGQADETGTFSAEISAVVGQMKVTVIANDSPIYTSEVTVTAGGPAYTIEGSTVTFNGSSGNDVFAFQAGQSEHSVTFNGQVYTFDASLITRIEFNGNGGTDQASLTGTGGADTATLRKGLTTLTGVGYTAVLTDVHTVVVNGQANDTAWLYDSAGDDTFVGTETWSTMSGQGFHSQVDGFGEVTAVGSTGNDMAELYGSTGDDVFTATSSYGQMSGAGYQNRAEGFDQIVASAGEGGNDVAWLYDSAGDDQFFGRQTYGFMRGSGVLNVAVGFDRINAIATAGGNDMAWLYDSAGDDQFVGRSTYSTLSNSTHVNYAEGFDRVYGIGSTGNDTAELYDSTGDDLFVASASAAYMTGMGFHYQVQGFGTVIAVASAGGYDVAWLFDSAGDDVFDGRQTYSTMQGSGFLNYAAGFDRVNAMATAGGNDVAWLYDSTGDDKFVGTETYSYMSGSGFYNYTTGFDQVNAAASEGNDTAHLADSAGDDVFTASSTGADMTGVGFANRTEGFDRVFGSALNGGNDVAWLYDTAGDDMFYGRQDRAYMVSSTFLRHALGFDRVNAVANAGGNDMARLFDSAGNDEFVSTQTFSAFYGDDFYNTAAGFDRIYAFASSGMDTARMADSADDDLFVATPTYAYMDGAGVRNYASGFDVTTATGSGGGDDQAYLIAGSYADSYTRTSTYGWVTDGTYIIYAGDGFERVNSWVSST